MGVGCSKRWSALNFPVVQRILIAWIFTLPAAAIVAYATARCWMALAR
jgi:phosphate/sulfate permease